MSDFTRVYPDDKRLQFDGGKNSKYEVALIADNESPDCQNVTFDRGAVETRSGFQRVNTTSVGSFAVDGLYTRRDNTGAETMVLFAGTHMYALATTTFVTIASAQSVFTAGSRVGTAQMENNMYIGNGGIIPMRYQGANFVRHGVYPQTVTATVASQAAGTLTGGYQYKLTNINSNLVESDVGPATTTFTAASATLRLTSIPVAPASFGVNSRRIYRTAAGGTTFKKVADLGDNTTTTYDDNLPDAGLGATAPTDNGVPPKYNTIIFHQDRLFMNDSANGSFLWYTNRSEPYTVASTNFRIIGDSTSDLIKGFAVYENSLVIFCERTFWLLYMPSTDDTTWVLVKGKSSYGTKSPYCIFEYNNKIMFAAFQNDKFVGFAEITGDQVNTSATLLTTSNAKSERTSDRIEPDIFLMQEGFANLFSAIVYKNKAYIAVPYGSNQTTNNRIYQYDFSIERFATNNEAAWSPWTGLAPSQFCIYGGNLYFGSSAANGYVYSYSPGTYNDDGVAIDSYFYTKEYPGYKTDYNNYKDFRYVSILYENSGTYYMNLTYRVDSDSGVGNTTTIQLNPGGSLWGTMVWGTDVWGGAKNQTESRVYLGQLGGKRIQFKFSNQNTINQKFKVYGMTFRYNRKGWR